MIPEYLPTYETYRNLTPSTPNLISTLHLSSIIPGATISDWPQELDPAIAMASVDLNSDGIAFTGQLLGTPPTNAAGDPIPPTGFYLDTVDLYASYTKSTGEKQLNLGATVDVYSSDPTDFVAFRISIDYDDSDATKPVWQLSGLIQNLNMGHLFNFFPGADGTPLMNIMDHIELQTLGVDWTYSDGKCSFFDIEAVLVIDPVELQLSFTRTVATDWNFIAKLTAAPTVDTTFLTILKSLVKDNTILDNIPSFLDIPINSKDTGASLQLLAQGVEVPNADAKTSTDFMSVVLMLTIGDVEVSFIQLQEKSGAATSNTASSKAATSNTASSKATSSKATSSKAASTSPVTKRLLHVSLSAIPFPSIPKIPLVGQLSAPFDEIDYDWVHDDSTGAGDKGLTRMELAAINGIPGFPGVKFQDNMKPANPNDPSAKGPQPTDILLLAGSHLIISNSAQTGSSSTPNVVLDYVFAKPTPPASGPTTSLDSSDSGTIALMKAIKAKNKRKDASSGLGDSRDDPSPETGNPTTMAKMEKSQGPLSFSNVGLRYENQTITFVFDALVKLGPIEFELIGFGLKLAFTGGLSIKTLESIIPTPVITGLACSFNNPPVEIAGIFLNLSTPGLTRFVGGVDVSIPPWSLLAVGSYSESTFKSIFIFAQLEGPLIEVEVVEVSGVSGKKVLIDLSNCR